MTRFARLACLAALATAPLSAAPALAQQADDPLAGLSGKVAGLLDIDTPNARIMLAEEDHGVANSWFLTLGDEYADGWRLAAVGANAFVMQKGDETREVPVNRVARAGGALPVLALNTATAPIAPTAGVTARPAPQGPAGRGARGAGAAGRASGANVGGNAALFQGGRGLLAPPPPAPAPPPATVNLTLPNGNVVTAPVPARPLVLDSTTAFAVAREGEDVGPPELPPGVDPSALQQVTIQTADGQTRTVYRVDIPPPQ